MFTISFVVILTVITYINNATAGIENDMAYKFNQKGNIIILSFLVLAITLDFLRFFSILPVYVFFLVCALVLINQLRINAIRKEREHIKQVYEVLRDLLKQDIDYNLPPFQLKLNKKRTQIEYITLNIDDLNKFKDANITQAVHNLNKFMPYRQWVADFDPTERVCNFIGNKLPPDIAYFPGSDLRPSNWIPLGVSGDRELGWNINANPMTLGESLYVYENGIKPKTAEMSSAPHALVLGTTGGGKAIWLEQTLFN